jgi:hypothetical protein
MTDHREYPRHLSPEVYQYTEEEEEQLREDSGPVNPPGPWYARCMTCGNASRNEAGIPQSCISDNCVGTASLPFRVN